MTQKDCKRPESVLVLVHTRAGEVLLLERCHPAGYWQSVTGSLEWGESAEVAARRELEEETGLVAADLIDCHQSNRFPIHPAWRTRYASEVSFNTESVFRLEYKERPGVRVHGAEHVRSLWLPRREAAERVASETNREAILRFVPETTAGTTGWFAGTVIVTTQQGGVASGSLMAAYGAAPISNLHYAYFDYSNGSRFSGDGSQASPLAGGFAGLELDADLFQRWEDQTVYQLGGAYELNPKLTLRAGFNHAFNEAQSIDFSLQHAPEVTATNPNNGVTSRHSQTSFQVIYSQRF